jgi:hypothetical protein
MGGLAVSFFMYLMFLTPHPDSPIPTFNSLAQTYRTASTGIVVMMTLALSGIVWFSVRHVQLLVANLRQVHAFRHTAEYATLRSTNAEVQLMAIPLTLAMSVNVVVILAALAIPGLWTVELLIPAALGDRCSRELGRS